MFRFFSHCLIALESKLFIVVLETLWYVVSILSPNRNIYMSKQVPFFSLSCSLWNSRSITKLMTLGSIVYDLVKGQISEFYKFHVTVTKLDKKKSAQKKCKQVWKRSREIFHFSRYFTFSSIEVNKLSRLRWKLQFGVSSETQEWAHGEIIILMSCLSPGLLFRKVKFWPTSGPAVTVSIPCWDITNAYQKHGTCM